MRNRSPSAPTGPLSAISNVGFDRDGWTIGSAGSPQGVHFDPNEGPWGKTLNFPFPAAEVTDGQTFRVSEFLQIRGTHWTQWHERFNVTEGIPEHIEILTATLLVDGNPPLGLAVSPTGPLVANVSFRFDPLPPGTVIEIQKQIRYAGAAFTPAPLVRTFGITEHPGIPELGTFMLAGIGLGGLVGCTSRRRRLRDASQALSEIFLCCQSDRFLRVQTTLARSASEGSQLAFHEMAITCMRNPDPSLARRVGV